MSMNIRNVLVSGFVLVAIAGFAAPVVWGAPAGRGTGLFGLRGKRNADAAASTKQAPAAEGVGAEKAAQLPEAVLKKFVEATEYSKGTQGHAVLVMHKGEVIFERYDNGGGVSTPNPLASGTKSFTGVAAMIAVQEGLITLDEKVSETLTEWKSDPKKKEITVRQLLTLSSGLQPDSGTTASKRLRRGKEKGDDGGLAEASGMGIGGRPADWFAAALTAPMTGTPGGQFAYGPNHYYAFGAFFEKKLAAAGEPADIWAWYQKKVFTPIGMSIARIGRDQAGHPNLPGGAMLTAREWAKYGLMIAQGGMWTKADGTKVEVIKPEFLKQCFEPSAKNGNYGLTFWLRRGAAPAEAGSAANDSETRVGSAESLRERAVQRNLAKQAAAFTKGDGAKLDAVMAAGLGKQRLYIIPSLDLVVVRFAAITSENGTFDDTTFAKPIIEGVQMLRGEVKGEEKPGAAAPEKPAAK
ncbi:serine hydrolase domain-containing protein [soil metagenome]